MQARRVTCIFAAFLLAAFPLRAQTVSTGATVSTDAAGARIVAPERLRQGDPLLAWIVEEAAGAQTTGLEARLVDATGKACSSPRCFAASALLDGGSGSPLSAEKTPQVTVRPGVRLGGRPHGDIARPASRRLQAPRGRLLGDRRRRAEELSRRDDRAERGQLEAQDPARASARSRRRGSFTPSSTT